MAGPLYFDRVKESSTTTGTGSLTLAGSELGGFRSFSSVLATNDTTFYTIQNSGSNEWEVGVGTLTGATTLARTSVLSSSNANALVSFSAGTKDVWIDLPASKVAGMPRGYIDGLVLSVANATTQTLSIAAGDCRDDTNVVDMTLAAFTKVLQNTAVAWSSGTGGNGIDSGTAVASLTWYHVYVIAKPDTTADILFSTSASAPTMPTGYVYKRRIGSIQTLSNATASLRYIRQFTQVGDEFLWSTVMIDLNNVSVTSTAANYILTVPLGIKTYAHTLMSAATNTGTTLLYVYSPDKSDETATAGRAQVQVLAVGTGYMEALDLIRTNTSSQVRAVSTNANSSIVLGTHGWIDQRGKNA